MMSNPYRAYQPSTKIEIPKMSTYKYILRKGESCPICQKSIEKEIYSNYTYFPNPNFLFCHPLKRLVIK